MKKFLLFISLVGILVMHSSPLGAHEPSMIGQQIHFSVRAIDPTMGTLPYPRGPVVCPVVSIDDHNLYFYSVGDYAIHLVYNGVEVYNTTAPIGTYYIQLPYILSGTYELQVYDGSDYYYYSDIVL